MKGNVLGDIRAEQDLEMLNSAFWESSDYKALLESHDRSIIVGRRGTGKSALAYRLAKHWASKPKTLVISISPEEEQVIGLRDIFEKFGDKFSHIKAGAKKAWLYAIYMEVILDISKHYKIKNDLNISKIKNHVDSWNEKKGSITSKIRHKLISTLDHSQSSQARIADLSDKLEIDLIEEVLLAALIKSGMRYAIFVDKLDEGYSPDNLGVAIVDGFMQAAIDIKSSIQEKIITFVFIRDNIYRAVAKLDPDFTRNIEGQVIRLHWDEYNLFNLVCNRLKIAFKVSQESSEKIWNKFTANELKGREGFRTALKLTLYRPRDILVLLNEAFLRANSHDRSEIILEDIDITAKIISTNRLSDLHKEYEYIFPSLVEFTNKFANSKSELSLSEAVLLVNGVLQKDTLERSKQIDIFLFESPVHVIQRLYSIGFIGIYNEQLSSFVFCHDGKDPDNEFNDATKLLIHPCYRLALGLDGTEIKFSEAAEIHDEYEIKVSSISTEQRNQSIERLLQELNDIETGSKGAYDFESWCLKSIKIIFAGSLCNIELHPNKNGLQQRDIVGTNLEENKFWKRVLTDYNSRQIIFEIKNFDGLGAEEYRQLHSYLCKEYGNFAFIITRAFNNNLEKDKELYWAKEMYNNHQKVIIKLSYKFIEKHLKKIRSPQKHDALEKELNSLLDTYIRSYFIQKCK